MAKRKSKAVRSKNAGLDRAGLVLDGNGRARLRKPGPKSWTKQKEKTFLTILGDTCNVKLAAEEADVSPQHAYARRKGNAAFRAAWLDAIAVAYGRLELILLDRAFNGTEKIITKRDGSVERMVDYSNQVALTLLKMHRDTAIEADSELPVDEMDDLREKITRKLERLKRQQDERGGGADE